MLAVVLIAELVALMFAIARQALHDNFWLDLAGSSLFLLWIGLTCAGRAVPHARRGCTRMPRGARVADRDRAAGRAASA